MESGGPGYSKDILSADFPPHEASVARVRRFVEAALAGWRGDPSSVVLAASELAANVVLHARTPYTVRVGVGGDGTVRLEVSDGEWVVPQPTAEHGRDGGWGLRLVASIAERWGVDPHPDGKTVWVEVRPEPPDQED